MTSGDDDDGVNSDASMESHMNIKFKGDKIVGMKVKQVKKKKGKKRRKKQKMNGESFSSSSDFDSDESSSDYEEDEDGKKISMKKIKTMFDEYRETWKKEDLTIYMPYDKALEKHDAFEKRLDVISTHAEGIHKLLLDH